jgi:hypothetical protein
MKAVTQTRRTAPGQRHREGHMQLPSRHRAKSRLLCRLRPHPLSTSPTQHTDQIGHRAPPGRGLPALVTRHALRPVVSYPDPARVVPTWPAVPKPIRQAVVQSIC